MAIGNTYRPTTVSKKELANGALLKTCETNTTGVNGNTYRPTTVISNEPASGAQILKTCETNTTGVNGNTSRPTHATVYQFADAASKKEATNNMIGMKVGIGMMIWMNITASVGVAQSMATTGKLED